MARYFILSGETADGKLFAEPAAKLQPLKDRVNKARAAYGVDGKVRLRRLQLMDDAGNKHADVTFHARSPAEIAAEAKAKADAEAKAKAEQSEKEAADKAEEKGKK